MSPEKVTYRGDFRCRQWQRRRLQRPLFACPEHNFLTISLNDTKLGVHVSWNELVQSSRTITLPYVFLDLYPFDNFACPEHNFLP